MHLCYSLCFLLLFCWVVFFFLVFVTALQSGEWSVFCLFSVGPKGRVLSYEIRDDHHNLAKKNYRHWRSAWEIGHMDEWPDNVEFILKDISTAAADMKSVILDAVSES